MFEAYEEHKIGPFNTEEDCRDSQRDAVPPVGGGKTGCFWEGGALYYIIYIPKTLPAAAGDQQADTQDVFLPDILRSQLETVGQRFDVLPELLASSNRILEEHGLEDIAKELTRIHDQEGPNPPDDLYEELEKLLEKIRKLGTKDVFERKFPWRRQISLNHLISILIEILDILRKLYKRSLPRSRPQQPGGRGTRPRT